MSPHRPPRAPGFSYVGFHQYFLTICAYQRRTVFADQAHGQWVIDQLRPTARAALFAILAYCVMPDHVHLVLEGESEAADLRALIRRWKSATGYAWKQRSGDRLWQEGYFDHVLRAEDAVAGVLRYVLENPVRAGLVKSPGDYTLLGSDRYSLADLADVATDWKPRWRNDPGRV